MLKYSKITVWYGIWNLASEFEFVYVITSLNNTHYQISRYLKIYLQISVGYGTQTPQSIAGKAIGGFCAIVGVFILTLPVPIVVNSFASYYKNRLWRNEVAHKRTVRAAQQAELVKEILVSNNRRSSNVGNSSIAGKEIKWKNLLTHLTW